jgi:hypothetical protein
MLEMEEESRETRQWIINLALQDLLSAATDFFEARPELRELKVEKQDDGVWVILPDGTMHALPLDDHED